MLTPGSLSQLRRDFAQNWLQFTSTILYHPMVPCRRLFRLKPIDFKNNVIKSFIG
ncbi:hypothetical protein SAMN04487880_3181 [Marinobacter sp. es.042]|nr:hypothetical protein SAMN04487880_3181 [Marinobacter sp. es.042]